MRNAKRARRLARVAGVDNVIAFDMGGTTAKAALIEAGNLRITSEFEVGSSLSAHGLNLAGGGYAMKVTDDAQQAWLVACISGRD